MSFLKISVGENFARSLAQRCVLNCLGQLSQMVARAKTARRWSSQTWLSTPFLLGIFPVWASSRHGSLRKVSCSHSSYRLQTWVFQWAMNPLKSHTGACACSPVPNKSQAGQIQAWEKQTLPFGKRVARTWKSMWVWDTVKALPPVDPGSSRRGYTLT